MNKVDRKLAVDVGGSRSLRVSGKPVAVAAEAATPLLYVLRNDLGLHGPKFGCGLGPCGARTLHVNGEPASESVWPGIANAIYDAVGARLRRMPFTPDRVRAALGAKT